MAQIYLDLTINGNEKDMAFGLVEMVYINGIVSKFLCAESCLLDGFASGVCNIFVVSQLKQ